MLGMVKENRVNMIFVALAIVFGVLAVIFLAVGLFMIFLGSLGMLRTAGIFGILCGIFQLIVYYQWSAALRNNIENSRILVDYLSDKVEGAEKQFGFKVMREKLARIKPAVWAYWMYIFFYILMFFSGRAALFFIVLQFVMFAVYLQSIFSTSKVLQDIKTEVYSAFTGQNVDLHKIRRRNILTFILFSIITLGVYLLYIMIKLSLEINEYLDEDERLRTEILRKISERE